MDRRVHEEWEQTLSLSLVLFPTSPPLPSSQLCLSLNIYICTHIHTHQTYSRNVFRFRIPSRLAGAPTSFGHNRTSSPRRGRSPQNSAAGERRLQRRGMPHANGAGAPDSSITGLPAAAAAEEAEDGGSRLRCEKVPRRSRSLQ